MLNNLSWIDKAVSRSISAENFKGEKGKGGMSTDGAAKECASELGQGWKVSPYFNVESGETLVLANYKGMGMIKHIWITDSSPALRNLILRIYWDESPVPSVEVPLGDFFASSDYRNYSQISSLAVCVNPRRAFNCYWNMPFKKGFKITLENIHTEKISVYYQIDFEEREISDDEGYFHAQFRRTNPLTYKDVYTIADNIKGRGKYIGTYLFWSTKSNGWWGEGEIKFYIDGDDKFPTICGTGTEDYFCGSYNFDIGNQYREFTNLYSGLSKVIRGDGLYNSQQRFSMYRWHINDPIYFENDLKVTIQALGWRANGKYQPLRDDISSVAYWYQDSISETFPKLPDNEFLEIN